MMKRSRRVIALHGFWYKLHELFPRAYSKYYVSVVTDLSISLKGTTLHGGCFAMGVCKFYFYPLEIP